MKAALLNLFIGISLGAVAVASAGTAVACDCVSFFSETLTLRIVQFIQIDGEDQDIDAEESRWQGQLQLSQSYDESFSLHIEDGDINTRLTLEEVR